MNLSDIIRTQAALRQLAAQLGSDHPDIPPGHIIRLVTRVAQRHAKAGHRGGQLVEHTEREVRERLGVHDVPASAETSLTD